MKKIALFAAAMIICAGLSFAQNPVKKDNNSKAKTVQSQAVKADIGAAEKSGCGNCPHHKQCSNDNGTAVKAENKAAVKTDNKAAEKSCCNKETANKSCNKEASKSANCDKAATKK